MEIAAREWATWCAGGLSIAETKDAEEAAASVAVNAILSQWDGALILQKRGDQIILWDDKAEEILTLECMVDTLSFLQKVQKDLARNARASLRRIDGACTTNSPSRRSRASTKLPR